MERRAASHYGYTQEVHYVRNSAEQRIRELIPRLNNQIPIFVYSGMSGIAWATAFMLEYGKQRGDTAPYGMLYIRKEGERAHGGDVEYAFLNCIGNPQYVFVFVDDFVSSGATKNRVLAKSWAFLKKGLRDQLLDIDKNRIIDCLGQTGVIEIRKPPQPSIYNPWFME